LHGSPRTVSLGAPLAPRTATLSRFTRRLVETQRPRATRAWRSCARGPCTVPDIVPERPGAWTDICRVLCPVVSTSLVAAPPRVGVRPRLSPEGGAWGRTWDGRRRHLAYARARERNQTRAVERRSDDSSRAIQADNNTQPIDSQNARVLDWTRGAPNHHSPSSQPSCRAYPGLARQPPRQGQKPPLCCGSLRCCRRFALFREPHPGRGPARLPNDLPPGRPTRLLPGGCSLPPLCCRQCRHPFAACPTSRPVVSLGTLARSVDGCQLLPDHYLDYRPNQMTDQPARYLELRDQLLAPFPAPTKAQRSEANRSAWAAYTAEQNSQAKDRPPTPKKPRSPKAKKSRPPSDAAAPERPFVPDSAKPVSPSPDEFLRAITEMCDKFDTSDTYTRLFHEIFRVLKDKYPDRASAVSHPVLVRWLVSAAFQRRTAENALGILRRARQIHAVRAGRFEFFYWHDPSPAPIPATVSSQRFNKGSMIE
jgi:hypothetical protein